MSDTVKMRWSSFGQDAEGNIVRQDGEFDTGMTDAELNAWFEPVFESSPLPPSPYVDREDGPGDHNIYTTDGRWLYSCSNDAWEQITQWAENDSLPNRELGGSHLYNNIKEDNQ
jgi:hypothetical protein